MIPPHDRKLAAFQHINYSMLVTEQNANVWLKRRERMFHWSCWFRMSFRFSQSMCWGLVWFSELLFDHICFPSIFFFFFLKPEEGVHRHILSKLLPIPLLLYVSIILYTFLSQALRGCLLHSSVFSILFCREDMMSSTWGNYHTFIYINLPLYCTVGRGLYWMVLVFPNFLYISLLC